MWPMWTHENRSLYERKGERYPSNLTDAEWAQIDPPDYDVGKKFKGKKRHTLVYTLGLMLTAEVLPPRLQ